MNQKIKAFLLFSLLLSVIIIPITPSATIQKTSPAHRGDSIFDNIMTFLMRIGHFPSLSTCIINNEVIWSKGYGLYDLDEEKPATEYTKYMACSISKTITGMALMQLYDQGLFDLDDDVNIYLPFSLRNPHFPNESITFRMLLSHSSSINSDPVSFYWLNYSAQHPITWYPYPWIENYIVPGGTYYVLEIWNEKYKPGERAQYANANFVLIAYLVEVLSGETFSEYCDANIFAPLDMDGASFNLTAIDIAEVAIPYHFYLGNYLKITEIDWEMDPPPDIYYRMLHYPVGGLYISVTDLSHFLMAHMNGGVYNETRIISEGTLNEMHKIQPPLSRYALAWYYSETIYGRVFSGHEGDIPGYHNSMFMQHNNLDKGVIFFITGDRYTILGRNMALLIRNILFIKANLLPDTHIINAENGEEILDMNHDLKIPMLLNDLLLN